MCIRDSRTNYELLHPTGPKSDYAYHTEAMDRAMTGGIDDVGIGVLFGLETYRYDFIGLLMHADVYKRQGRSSPPSLLAHILPRWYGNRRSTATRPIPIPSPDWQASRAWTRSFLSLIHI